MREGWIAFLQGSDVFGGLPVAALQALVDASQEVVLEPGRVLFRQGDPADAMYVIREGRVVVFVEEKGEERRALAMLEAGQCVGEGALIMAGGRSASVRADTASRLLRLPTEAFERALSAHPSLRQVLSALVAARLPGLIDASLRSELRSELTWTRLARGEVLFRAGDPGDAVYVVARGRLGAFRDTQEGREELVAEIGRGEPVGEIALLTKEPRALTVKALRDTELVRLSAEGFETALVHNPQALVPVARTLAQRLRAAAAPAAAHGSVRTIAVLPMGPSVPVAPLLQGLEAGLREAGAFLGLGAREFDAIHGANASAASPDSALALHLTEWLNSVEGGHDFALYRCDPAPTAWTRLCVGRADRVLLVARGSDPAELGPFERLVADATAPSRELVLLHEDGRRLPSGTAAWLRAVRPARHHHVRLDRPHDALRVARFLTGRAVGLVLSGGGARAFAHAGVLRALREQRVAIDFVGGVSMGSFPTAAHAMGLAHEELLRAFRTCFVDVARPILPYTLPIVSIFSGGRGERALRAVYGDTRIEDLWINYFCVATDITSAELKLFREGPLWRAMRASGSFPGLFPPVPHEGHLLVDGGVFTNLPVDLMQDLCPGPVIASDVSKDVEMAVDPALSTAPLPGRLLWSRLNPFAPPVRFPSLASILFRSLDVREAAQRAQLRRAATFSFLPPVAQFALDQVSALDEIVAIGYQHAVERVGELPASISREGEDAG